jgi:outer membrane immunogenic protein
MRRLAAAGFFSIAILPHSAANGPLPPAGRVYTYEPPAIVQLYTWNGLYVGGHLGFGWNDTVVAESDGFLGGAQIGFNIRAGRVVFGLEGQWSGSGDDGNDDALLVLPGGLTGTFEAQVDWMATLTGRVGVPWDRSLFYVKGGAAWAENTYRGFIDTLPGVGVSGDEVRSGWAVGIGYEYAFRSNWSTRLEYVFLDFGSESVTLNGPAGRIVVSDVDQQIHALTLSVNYRFDWPIGGPLGTPY